MLMLTIKFLAIIGIKKMSWVIHIPCDFSDVLQFDVIMIKT